MARGNYTPGYPIQYQPGSNENIGSAAEKTKLEFERIYRLMEGDDRFADINDKLDDIINGNIKVGKAKEADVALKTKGTLTIERNGTSLGSFNGSADTTIDIEVPTSLSDLTGGSAAKKFFASGTYVVPPGVTKIYVTAYAGSGGKGTGGFSYYQGEITHRYYGGNGGFGAHVYNREIAVTPGESINITVGKDGGNNYTPPTNGIIPHTPGIDGNNGGATIIGRYLTLDGGKGGIAARNATNGTNGASSSTLEFGVYDCPCEIRCGAFDTLVFTEDQRKAMFVVPNPVPSQTPIV